MDTYLKISELAEIVRVQAEKMKAGAASRIEVDIMLAKLRELYELVQSLQGAPAETVRPVPEAPQPEPVQHERSPAVAAPAVATLFGDGPAPVKQKPVRGAGKNSAQDRIADNRGETSLASKHLHKPIADLKAAIGINEKFIFVNGLFGGNADEYHAAVEFLNRCASLQEAEDHLQNTLAGKYGWNAETEPVAAFRELIERRFL